jgi:acyl-coenzyme A synthetase/AMP-(fatty) acid ligase
LSNLVYALRSMGVGKGDRVLVLAPNTPLIADCIQAVTAMGSILVPINTRLREPEAEYLLEHSGSCIVLVDYELQHLVKSAKVPVVVCNDTGDASDPYEAFLRKGADFDRKNGHLGWRGIEFDADENVTSALCYTSGTTGKPKGVELHNRGGYLAALANVIEMGLTHESRYALSRITRVRLTHEIRYLWILPQFHAIVRF